MSAQHDDQALPDWAAQMKALEPVGANLIAKWGRPSPSEAERQDMYKLALGILSEGYLCHVYMDPARPVWVPLWNHAYNQGGPVPDYVYMTTEVDADGIYRISGYRGTQRFVEINQRVVRIMRNRASIKPPPGNIDLDDLTIGPDGYFSVILSAERPEGYSGDWWQLGADATCLLMRKCSADWRNEIEARVAIERLDDCPPSSPEDFSKRFSEMAEWVEGMITFDMELVKYYREHHGLNQVLRSQVNGKPREGGPKTGGLQNQVYYDGIYEIEDDEALIVETDLPKSSRYWQALVSDDRFATVDWYNRQSSLNDVQAHVDSDGKFRFVVSARDPGVPNWLDKADNKWGIIQLRWNKPSDEPDPTTTRVKLADVRKHLPADTPVVTPEQRKQQLRERREAAQFRKLW